MNSKWRNKNPINFLASHKRKFIKVIITLLNLVHTVIPFTFFTGRGLWKLVIYGGLLSGFFLFKYFFYFTILDFLV